MIYPDIKATGKCDEPGCNAETPFKLVLGLAGGFMFEPPQEPGWQMVVATRPGQPVSLRCPAHNRKVDTGESKIINFRKAN